MQILALLAREVGPAYFVHRVKIGTAFVRVSGLVDAPAALLRPRVALRVLSITGSNRRK